MASLSRLGGEEERRRGQCRDRMKEMEGNEERDTAEVGEDEKRKRAADDVLGGTIGRKWFNRIESNRE